ncbi:hypothetical protein IQE94_05575 [Synechocystis sp. PCC 7339]|jgi:hypothetical protein|uniref:hypothetical protein n=1 Tax=unclassified Synechocystis TaxID=2640012 RepID=UPI00138E58C1|nr:MULTISPECIES: hypothetical protein [unclassified Synechocystis]QHU99592.1 hypothetical protein BWK47_05235 [Synechocystis sp. CACIAM 05]UAJ73752.1 hypothetical protein IQE94_05575 [Synechocystis sp. PCC 7339]
MKFIPLENPDPAIYQDEDWNLWRCGGKTDDGYFIMFECDDVGQWNPQTSYAEEFAPHEMDRFVIVKAILTA